MGNPFVRAAAAACALLLLATACGGAEEPPKPSAAPPELSLPDYQQKLDGLVAAIRPLTDQLTPAATLEQVNQIRLQLGTVLREQHTAFGKFRPPQSAAQPHQSLTANLSSLGNDLRTPISSTGNNSCGVPLPEALRLHEAKVTTRKTMNRPTAPSLPEAFAKANIQFAGLPVPPEPAMPELETRRPGNGDLLQRGPGGPTTVTIANNSKLDAVVSAVAGEDPARPQASVFVRHDSTVTLSGLSVPFELYYKFGTDFDAQRRGFTRDCEYRRIHGPLDTPGRWSVGLSQNTIGKALLLRLTPSGASDYRSVRIAQAAPF